MIHYLNCLNDIGSRGKGSSEKLFFHLKSRFWPNLKKRRELAPSFERADESHPPGEYIKHKNGEARIRQRHYFFSSCTSGVHCVSWEG